MPSPNRGHGEARHSSRTLVALGLQTFLVRQAGLATLDRAVVRCVLDFDFYRIRYR